MTPTDPLLLVEGLTHAVERQLRCAPAPLKVAEIGRSIPRPKKVKISDHQKHILTELEEQVRLGKAFCYPSGKAGEPRYWSRDERQLLRTKAVEHAHTPLSLSSLKAKLGKEVKGVTLTFVEEVIRELIGDDLLFECPPKSKKGGPLFGATPPPAPLPPLEQPKHQKALGKLLADCNKLLTVTGASVDELLRIIRVRIAEMGPTAANGQPAMATSAASSAPANHSTVPARPNLDDLILDALKVTPVLSLAELRHSLPTEFRGPTFDQAVLRLADEHRVVVSQDAIPARFSEAERAAFVQDGEALLTTIARRNGS